ncbi:hypothetical protein V5799_017365 [Amblyomma americanum]|uniref:Uncharacterized protein n=1 Tax=Amblyomma americanum TaxID=6943 RepID=A0AAQ4F2C3_AMBAM
MQRDRSCNERENYSSKWRAGLNRRDSGHLPRCDTQKRQVYVRPIAAVTGTEQARPVLRVTEPAVCTDPGGGKLAP